MTRTVIKAIEKKKGDYIIVIDLQGKHETVANTFIICEASSTQQTKAIAREIRDKTKEELHHLEGLTDARWIVIDYWDLVVHIMTPEHRKFYNIEELWMDMPQYSIPSQSSSTIPHSI